LPLRAQDYSCVTALPLPLEAEVQFDRPAIESKVRDISV
jgi:hypothetical protein